MAASLAPPTSKAVGANITGQSPERAVRMRMKAWVTVSPPEPYLASPTRPCTAGSRTAASKSVRTGTA